MRILITGAAGFIGSHAADRLLADGHIILALDNFNDFYDPQEKRRNIAAHLEHKNYRLLEVDICDHLAVRTVTQEFRPDAVLHIAARAGVRPSLETPLLYQATNVGGTLALLEAARFAGVQRFVFASSSSVYGNNEKVPFSEEDQLRRPASPYAATKISAEALCACYSELYRITITSLRLFTVYGPRQRPDLAIRKFSENMIDGKPITLFGDGSTSRDYTFVGDIVEGMMRALLLSDARHRIINLGNHTPVRLSELVQALENALGRSAVVQHGPEQPGDVRNTWADITQASTQLGYRPVTPLERGLDIMMQWLTDIRRRGIG